MNGELTFPAFLWRNPLPLVYDVFSEYILSVLLKKEARIIS